MEYLNAYVLVAATSAVVILSYIFSGIARKTNIPSVLMLVALGVGIAELLKLVQVHNGETLFRVLEVVGLVGLIMIVLEAALDLKLSKERQPLIIRSILVGLFGMLACSYAIAYLLDTVLHLGWFIALVYAIPLSVVSSAIVIPSVARLLPAKKEFLVYESTFSDIFGILFFNIVVSNADGGTMMGLSAHVVINLVVSTLIALIISYSLIYLLQRSHQEIKLFFLIAILVLLYTIGKMLNLSALVIILVFGLVLNNVEVFFRGRLKEWIMPDILQTVVGKFHVVTLESAFVVRTFFFVIFGMTLNLASLLNLEVGLISLGILGIIYLLRLIILKMSGKKGLLPELFVSPRGLITVLLFFAIPQQILSPAFDSGILLYVILGTSLIMTFGLIAYGKEGAWVKSLEFDDWEKLDGEIEALQQKHASRGKLTLEG